MGANLLGARGVEQMRSSVLFVSTGVWWICGLMRVCAARTESRVRERLTGDSESINCDMMAETNR